MAIEGQLNEAERRLITEAITGAAKKPLVAIEVGTWLGGGSTLHILRALEQNGTGHLWGIEADRALKNEPLTIYGDGGQTRDFIFVKDVVAANAHFALNSTATGVFNVAGGSCITIKALAEEIRRLTGSRSEIVHAPGRAGDVKHSVADIGRLRAAGFLPAAKIQDALPATIQYFQTQGRQP
jgi:nucleoside-diphosphate-sugar epimerase